MHTHTRPAAPLAQTFEGAAIVGGDGGVGVERQAIDLRAAALAGASLGVAVTLEGEGGLDGGGLDRGECVGGDAVVIGPGALGQELGDAAVDAAGHGGHVVILGGRERMEGEAAVWGVGEDAVGDERVNVDVELELLNEEERRIVAHHEMGHALVAAAMPGTDVVHKVSIIPRGIGALGYTIRRPTEDRYLMTRPELEAKMALLLGGRAAE